MGWAWIYNQIRQLDAIPEGGRGPPANRQVLMVKLTDDKEKSVEETLERRVARRMSHPITKAFSLVHKNALTPTPRWNSIVGEIGIKRESGRTRGQEIVVIGRKLKTTDYRVFGVSTSGGVVEEYRVLLRHW